MHLHSCYSWLNNKFPSNRDGEKDVDEYIKRIQSSGLSVIGLTNYFNFSDKDFELKNQLEKTGMTVFMNLELRLTNINKADDLFDYHILFDNKLDDNIIKNFLAQLTVNMGSRNRKANTLNSNNDIGQAAVDFSSLEKVLKDESLELNGRYLTGFLSRGHGSATSDNQKKNQNVYEEITRKSDFIIHSSDSIENLQKDRIFWLKFKYIKPLLQSSDAHKLEDIGTKYSWIKADLTFDGLRQILFEPEYRISIQKEKPEQKSRYLVIDHIKYTGKKIYLNENLNTIIGGRSTGKSTLLNTIARKLNNKNFIKGKLHEFDEEIEIVWQDNEDVNDREVEFLPQEYMINLANEENSLNELVQRIIKRKNLNEQIDKYEKSIYTLKQEIQNLLQQYFELKVELSNLVKPEGDKKGIQIQIEILQEKEVLIRKESNFSVEDNQLYQEQIKKIDQFKFENKQLQQTIKEFETLQEIELINEINIDNVHDSYKEEIIEFITEIKQEVKEKWLTKMIALRNKAKSTKIENSNKIYNIEQSAVYISGNQFTESNRELSELVKQNKSEKEKLVEFQEYENKKGELENHTNDIQKLILEGHAQYKVIRNELQNKFSIKELDLEIKIEFSRINFEEKIKYFDSRNQYNNIFIKDFDDNLDAQLKIIFSEPDFKFNQGKSIDDLIKDVFSNDWHKYDFRIYYQNDEFQKMSQGKRAFVILKLLLEFSDDKKPVLIDQPEDSLDNRAIYHELTKYLKEKKKERQIILVTHNPNVVVGADSENVIVANQHSILTPNEKENKFDYVNGSLENSKHVESELFVLKRKGIREHVFEILEGGPEAFKKREQKYNLK